MSKQHSLDLVTFMSQTWLIEPEAGAMLLAQVVNGQILLTSDWEDPVHFADPNWAYYPTAQKENSTAILNVTGVIYDYYVNYLCSKLDLIYADKNVTSMIVRVNGPGGAANAAAKLADKIMAAPFPTLGYVDYGMAASAHFMVYAACDQRYASRPNDKVGSIGTYIPYQNWSKQLEKMGVVLKDIYAKQSTQKNEEFRQAAEGDFSLLQKMADDEATRFINFVKARIPDIDTSKNDPFKGRLFSASDGLEIGLLHGIGDLRSAVKAVRDTSSNANVTPRTTMLGFVKLATLAAMKGAEASAFTSEKLEALNADLVAAGFKGIVIVSEAEYEKAVDAMNATPADPAVLATAQADVTRLTAELTTEKGKVTALTGQLTEAQNEVTRLGGLNGAERTKVTTQTQTQPDAGQGDDSSKIMASLEHNASLPEWLQNMGAEAK